MTLSILLSVPHAGVNIPQEVEDICMLNEEDIRRDGDEGADQIYFPLESEVEAMVTTEVARAIVVPADRELLHAIPQDYVVDGVAGVQDPTGMESTRLESEVCVVTASSVPAQNLRQAIQLLRPEFPWATGYLSRDESSIASILVHLLPAEDGGD